MKRLFLAASLVVTPSMCASALFGPSTYGECITSSMKGVTSDVAARAIVHACRSRFPEKSTDPGPIDLPREVLAKITGRAGMDSDSQFSGTIYNGNEGYTITQITVALVPKTKSKAADKSVVAREYSSGPLYVLPLTTGRLYITVDVGGEKDVEWGITRARGYKSR